MGFRSFRYALYRCASRPISWSRLLKIHFFHCFESLGHCHDVICRKRNNNLTTGCFAVDTSIAVKSNLIMRISTHRRQHWRLLWGEVRCSRAKLNYKSHCAKFVLKNIEKDRIIIPVIIFIRRLTHWLRTANGKPSTNQGNRIFHLSTLITRRSLVQI